MSAPPVSYQLPARQTAEDAQNLYDALRDLDPKGSVEIDASRVQRLSTIVVQILIAARRHLSDDGAVKIISPSRDFERLMKLVGIDISFFAKGDHS